MTNKEAIKNLEKLKSFHNGSYGTAIDFAIKALDSYDKIIEQIKDEAEYAYADFGAYADEHGLDEEYDFWFHKGLERAVEIMREVIANDIKRTDNETPNLQDV